MGVGGSLLGGKAAGRETDYSPTSAEVKNTWIYTSTPPYVFVVQCLVKHRVDFFTVGLSVKLTLALNVTISKILWLVPPTPDSRVDDNAAGKIKICFSLRIFIQHARRQMTVK
jgi:hypothetical protein